MAAFEIQKNKNKFTYRKKNYRFAQRTDGKTCSCYAANKPNTTLCGLINGACSSQGRPDKKEGYFELEL